jgi:hypothetical protein
MRQRRDKTKHPEDGDDGHRGIPRDADGNPIFLILPAKMRATLDRYLEQCEAAWREGEPLAVAEALTWIYLYRQPVPKWLEEAVVALAIGRRTKQQAKHLLEANIRVLRYQTVRDLKVGIPGRYGPSNADRSWEETYEKAAEILRGTRVAGSSATMKADYMQVRRDYRAGRHGKYFFLKDYRYRHNGKPVPPTTQDSLRAK